jgi:hypothetical protein
MSSFSDRPRAGGCERQINFASLVHRPYGAWYDLGTPPDVDIDRP